MDKIIQKGFLQSCINLSSLPTSKAFAILKSMYEAHNVDGDVTRNELENIVEELNSKLKDLNQSISFFYHPLAREEFLVFSLLSESSICTRQDLYSNAEQYYFSHVLEQMVHHEEYGLSWTEVYSVPDELQKQISKSRMQELLIQWASQGYFLEKDYILFLGPRILVEFAKYLQANFRNLVSDCPLCTKIVMWDIKCSDCGTLVHLDCIQKYLRRMSTCPSCSKKWVTPLNRPTTE